MEPRTPWALAWASLFALPTAVLAQDHLPLAAFVAVLGIGFALGTRHPCRRAGLLALPALLAALRLPEPEFVWPAPGPVRVEGVVAAVERAPLRGETTLLLTGAGRGVPLRITGALAALPGDRVSTTARLVAGAVPGAPPSLHAPAGAVHVRAGPFSVPRALAAVRRALETELLRLVPGEEGTLLALLTLGRGTATSGDLAQAHRATGLSHLLAVSGAHAAVLAWLLGLGGARPGHRLAAGRRRTLLALLVLLGYAAVTGNEPPVLRTVVAFALGALATAAGRPLGLATGLLPPAVLTAFAQPAALLGPSFQLSYAAVIGLAAAGHAGRGFWRRWLVAPLVSSVWATLLTAPLTLFWFGQIAPWTVLLTPLLGPLVGALLLLGLCAAVLGNLVPGAADPLGPLLGALAHGYAAAVRAADLLPGTPLQAPFVPPDWALWLAGAGALLVLERWRSRRGLAAAAALACLPHFVPLQPPEPPHLRLFAVGHGQAAVVWTAAGAQVAIDCGSLQLPERAARDVVAALARRRLDVLIVTHADQDHHNGVPALLRQLPIAAAVLPEALRGSPVAAELLENGTEVHFAPPGTSITPAPDVHVLAPALPPTASDNDQSLWVTVNLDGVRAVLTGDAEEAGLRAVLADPGAPTGDVLVLPHHGRPNGLAPLLLQHVRPRACFASAASGDGETALAGAVRGSGADLWVTGRHGDLDLRGGPRPVVSGSLGAPPLPMRRN